MLAAGKNPADYQHFVYLYPSASGCPVGGSNQTGPNGEKRVFINGPSGMTLPVIAHEMGHSFGLRHSDALDCDVTPLGNTCSTIGYGDAADTMAGEGHFNAYWKERLGWLNTLGTPPITEAKASGRYQIARYETPGTTSKAVKILRAVDPTTGRETWFYVEYRQAIGFDAILADRGNLVSGVLIRMAKPTDSGGTSVMLDMAPNSSPSATYEFQDAALTVGKTFSDPTSGIAVTLVSADGNTATLDVTVGDVAAPPPPPPTSTLTESVGTDKTQYARGSTVSMSALVKRDGVAVNGASVQFTVTLSSGAKATINATSGSDGYARGTYRTGKSKSAVGAYGLRADATSNGSTVSGNASFSVY
jgi:hypothetical protein